MIVAGIGARGGATAQEIAEAVRDACGRAGLEVSEVGIVCGMQRAAVTEAASELSVQAKLCTLDELRADARNNHGFTASHCVTGMAGRQPVSRPTGSARSTEIRLKLPPLVAY